MGSGIAGVLRRMMEARLDRDGQVPALEAEAGLFDAPAPEHAGRRDAAFAPSRDILDRSLSLKVLDGWLQNRHQILVPLAFRLDRLEADDVTILMQFAAATLLNAAGADPARRRTVERWLLEVGAGEAGLGQLRAAEAEPVPLSRLMQAIAARELQPYAYAVAVVAADTREPAGHLFASYVAARLGLPADAVRSVDRRFRH